MIRQLLLAVIVLPLFLQSFPPTLAQADDPALQDPEPVILTAIDSAEIDADIAGRIESILQVIPGLTGVEVAVEEGVVNLSGSVPNEAAAIQAQEIAIRTQDVVTVKDSMERTLAVADNIRPLWQKLKSTFQTALKALPLFAVSLALAAACAILGAFLANRKRILGKIAPNAFLAELLSQSIRIAGFLAGVVIALNLLGAGGLVATIIGGAGVVGIALGFAVRDSIDNYISSIMLSLRQPFRAKDHVVINDHEGIVVRLTSRATILMTLDGNHLRLPNSDVFKGTILNYSTNPERRFEFELGVDADDDPISSITTGLDAIRKLPFLLREPEPSAKIVNVGDSNIVLAFYGWVDQRHTDFAKARSNAIRAAKLALEAAGFTLPEPIYRLRVEGSLPSTPTETRVTAREQSLASTADSPTAVQHESKVPVSPSTMDVEPDRHLNEKVEHEVRKQSADDLLDNSSPRE